MNRFIAVDAAAAAAAADDDDDDDDDHDDNEDVAFGGMQEKEAMHSIPGRAGQL